MHLRGDLRDRPVPDLDGTWLKAVVEDGTFARALIYNSVRSDSMKFFITHRAEYLLNTRLDPRERQILVRFTPQAASECRRLCYCSGS